MGLFQKFRRETLKRQSAPPEGQPDTPTSLPAITAPLTGAVVPMKEIPDPVFAEGVLGVCVGIEPGEGTLQLCAPMTGTVTQCSDTGHAVGITAPDGKTAVLLHAGIDTVEMAGDGFALHVQEGDSVAAGQAVLTMNTDKVRLAGHPCTVVVIVTETEIPVQPAAEVALRTGETLFTAAE